MSYVKGDVSSESYDFQKGNRLVIDYLEDRDSPVCDSVGRFTAKYRKVTLYGKLGVLSEVVELNPFYDRDAGELNSKWQKDDSFGTNLEVIHEGLSLDGIKDRVSDGKSYLVVIWKKGNAPLPVDLGFHRDVTLSVIDSAGSVAGLTFNVINIVRSMNG